MKKSFIVALGSFVIAIGVATSCKGKDDNTDNVNTTEVTTDAESFDSTSSGATAGENGSGTSVSTENRATGASESASGGNREERLSGDGSEGRTESTSVNRSKNIQQNTGEKKSTKGYSAADGTDAENHDGDPYTKHDTTSMPTGTIK